MSLVSAVQDFVGHELTGAEATSLAQLQQAYNLDDEDPIIVVLAMLGANRVMLEEAPHALKNVSMQMIELHRQTLLEQSKYTVKSLISVVAQELNETNKTYQKMWAIGVTALLSGCLIGAGIVYLLQHRPAL